MDAAASATKGSRMDRTPDAASAKTLRKSVRAVEDHSPMRGSDKASRSRIQGELEVCPEVLVFLVAI